MGYTIHYIDDYGVPCQIDQEYDSYDEAFKMKASLENFKKHWTFWIECQSLLVISKERNN